MGHIYFGWMVLSVAKRHVAVGAVKAKLCSVSSREIILLSQTESEKSGRSYCRQDTDLAQVPHKTPHNKENKRTIPLKTLSTDKYFNFRMHHYIEGKCGQIAKLARQVKSDAWPQ